jgi:hypothetical protein
MAARTHYAASRVNNSTDVLELQEGATGDYPQVVLTATGGGFRNSISGIVVENIDVYNHQSLILVSQL